MVSSQQFVPITDIHNDLVFLKDGGVSLIISTSAVNFGLLFETEQISIIETFAGLLNSLSFPIQIVIRSKRLDVSSYLGTLDEASIKQANPLIKDLTQRFRKYVESIIKENNVLDKQFYVCIKVTSPELGVLPKNPEIRTKSALTILIPRRDHLMRQLSRLGLKTKQLNNIDLVSLLYDIYNGPAVETPKIINQKPQVVENPTPSNFVSHPTPPNVIPAPLKTESVAAAMPKPIAPAQTTPLTPPFVVEELTDDYGT